MNRIVDFVCHIMLRISFFINHVCWFCLSSIVKNQCFVVLSININRKWPKNLISLSRNKSSNNEKMNRIVDLVCHELLRISYFINHEWKCLLGQKTLVHSPTTVINGWDMKNDPRILLAIEIFELITFDLLGSFISSDRKLKGISFLACHQRPSTNTQANFLLWLLLSIIK